MLRTQIGCGGDSAEISGFLQSLCQQRGSRDAQMSIHQNTYRLKSSIPVRSPGERERGRADRRESAAGVDQAGSGPGRLERLGRFWIRSTRDLLGAELGGFMPDAGLD